jgi:hypothetical protein
LACKNYVYECLSVLEIIPSPTANGNVEGVNMVAGAVILNFLNIYIQQTPVNAPYRSVDNSRF